MPEHVAQRDDVVSDGPPAAVPTGRPAATTAVRPDTGGSRLTPRSSRLLTASLVFSAVLFVALTVGSSLIGSTAFYGGGLLTNAHPWVGPDRPPVEVSNNFVGDTIDFFIPGRSEIVDRVRDGDFPGWSSRQGAGADLASVPTYGLLAPTGAAWWLLPPDLAPGWEKLSVLVVATAGTALFLRRLGTGRHAAWLGGMVYAATGFMIAWTNWPQAGVAAMLPWLLWSVERAVQLRTWRSVVPVALSVCFLLLGGFPAVAGHGIYVAGGYVLLRLGTRRPEGGRRLRPALADAGRLLAGLVTGVLLAGVQLAVFVYAYLDLDTSYREDSFTRVVPPRMILTSLFPNVWGTRGGPPFQTGTNPIESNAYLGAAGVVLLAVALLVRQPPGVPRGVRTYLAGVVAVGGLLIYVQPPPLGLLGELPVFSGNAIGRLVAVVLLCAAVLAGLAFDAVIRSDGSASRWEVGRLRVGLALVVAGIGGAGAWAYLEAGPALGRRATLEIIAIAVGGGVLTAVAVGLAVRRPPSWRGGLLSLVPVVVAVQGVTAAAPAWAQVDDDAFYPVTPVHDFLLDRLGPDRIAVTGSAMVNGSTAYYGIRSATGHVFSTPEFNELQNAICGRCRLSPTYWVFPPGPDLDLWTSPGLDRMGVRYLSSSPGHVMPGPGEWVHRGGGPLELPAPGEPDLTVPVPGGPTRGVVLTVLEGAPEGSGTLRARLYDERGDMLLETSRFLTFPQQPGLLPLPMAGEFLPPGGQWSLQLSWEGSAEPPVLSGNEAGFPDLTLIRPAPDGLRLVHDERAVVWERLDTLPRVRWASTARVIASGPDRLAAVAAGELPPRTVVLNEAGPATDGRPASVDVLEDSGDRVRMRVRAYGAGYLVLADSVQSDWTATVDGTEREIVAADHAFGAVHLTAGTHDVTFEYTPRGQRTGYLASGAGLLALAALALSGVPWRRNREAGRPPRDSPGG